MHVTRRSLLYTLGAVPAALSVSRLAHSLGLQTAPGGTGPSPNSIYVLLEGPWLLYPSQGGMAALTLDHTDHQCQVGKWTNGDINPVTFLNPKQTRSIKVANAAAGKDFQGLFSDASAFDNFAWIRKGKHDVKPTGTERRVTLPMPTRVQIAGFLVNATVSNAASTNVLNADNVHPHITTVLEYAPSGQGPLSLALRSSPKSVTTYAPGDHVIFRMRMAHPTCPDVPHVKAAFSFLTARVKSQANPPIDLSAITTTDYNTGSGAPGFTDIELGLEHPHCGAATTTTANSDIHTMESFANCAGITLIAGS